MSRRTSIIGAKPQSEINMTPLMDLTFVLLITFIITFPLIEQGIPIKLPSEKTAPLPERKSHTVSINASGDLFVDNAKIDSSELLPELRRLKDMDPDVSILVRADETLRYAKVVNVLKALHEARITRMALVTQSPE